MKFSPKCRTKNLGMIYTILVSFWSFLNWEGADIQPQISPRKIPDQDELLISLDVCCPFVLCIVCHALTNWWLHEAEIGRSLAFMQVSSMGTWLIRDVNLFTGKDNSQSNYG